MLQAYGACRVRCVAVRAMSVMRRALAWQVPSLLKLMDGGYGARPTQPGHMLVLLNPAWTSADSVGQPWQR